MKGPGSIEQPIDPGVRLVRNAVIEPIMAEVCFVLLCRPSLPNGWIEVGQWPLLTAADIRRIEGNDRVADRAVVGFLL